MARRKTKKIHKNRYIGFVHRVKQTAAGEARPTMVIIIDQCGNMIKHELKTEADELEFVLGLFVLGMRKTKADDDLSTYMKHHIKWRALKDDEDADDFPTELLRSEGEDDEKTYFVATNVPKGYEGLKANDIVGACLGGSGDRFSFALSRQADQDLKGQAVVMRIPPIELKTLREQMGREKKDDALTLAELVRDMPEKFQRVTVRERKLIKLRGVYEARMEALESRKQCAQRFRQRSIGRVFCSEEGLYPEGSLEDAFARDAANYRILQALLKEEAACNRELKAVVEALPVWQYIFDEIPGVGPAIAAGIIAAIGDIRRFRAEPDPEKMTQLADKCQQHEIDGDLIAGLELHEVKTRIAAKKAEGKTVNMYVMTQMVRDHWNWNDQPTKAVALDKALDIHKERSRLRSVARKHGGPGKLKAYMGVHVLSNQPPSKQFPRKRTGQVANWNTRGRQALYQLGDQFNRRPDTFWGAKLRENKVYFRNRHQLPVKVKQGLSDPFRMCEQFFLRNNVIPTAPTAPITTQEELQAWFDQEKVNLPSTVNNDELLNIVRSVGLAKASGKVRQLYGNAHIHKMATWRTLSQFVEWLFHKWNDLEIRLQAESTEESSAA
jgi:hypothetical protein